MDLRSDDLDPLDGLGLGCQLVELAEGPLALLGLQPLLQLLDGLRELFDGCQNGVFADVQLAGHLGQNPGLLLVMLQRPDPGHGLDAADAGRDGLLRDDFQYADVANPVDVGAAAKLLAVEAARGTLVGNRHYAHVVLGILVAEEGQRPGSQSVFQRSDIRFDLGVQPDFVVDLLLNVLEFFGVDVREVRKVKPQSLGGIERAGLLDVRAQDVAQRGVDEVRAAMIAN